MFLLQVEIIFRIWFVPPIDKMIPFVSIEWNARQLNRKLDKDNENSKKKITGSQPEISLPEWVQKNWLDVSQWFVLRSWNKFNHSFHTSTQSHLLLSLVLYRPIRNDCRWANQKPFLSWFAFVSDKTMQSCQCIWDDFKELANSSFRFYCWERLSLGSPDLLDLDDQVKQLVLEWIFLWIELRHQHLSLPYFGASKWASRVLHGDQLWSQQLVMIQFEVGPEPFSL